MTVITTTPPPAIIYHRYKQFSMMDELFDLMTVLRCDDIERDFSLISGIFLFFFFFLPEVNHNLIQEETSVYQHKYRSSSSTVCKIFPP